MFVIDNGVQQISPLYRYTAILKCKRSHISAIHCGRCTGSFVDPEMIFTGNSEEEYTEQSWIINIIIFWIWPPPSNSGK